MFCVWEYDSCDCFGLPLANVSKSDRVGDVGRPIHNPVPAFGVRSYIPPTVWIDKNGQKGKTKEIKKKKINKKNYGGLDRTLGLPTHAATKYKTKASARHVSPFTSRNLLACVLFTGPALNSTRLVCAICLLALPHIFYLLFKECSVLPPKPTEQLDCHLSTFHPNHRTHLHSCKEEPILLSRWRLSRRCLARDYHSLSQ